VEPKIQKRSYLRDKREEKNVHARIAYHCKVKQKERSTLFDNDAVVQKRTTEKKLQ